MIKDNKMNLLKKLARNIFPVTEEEVERFIVNAGASKRAFVEHVLNEYLHDLMCNDIQSISLPTGGPVIEKNNMGLSWHRDSIDLTTGKYYDTELTCPLNIILHLSSAITAKDGTLRIGEYVIFRDLGEEDLTLAKAGLQHIFTRLVTKASESFTGSITPTEVVHQEKKTIGVKVKNLEMILSNARDMDNEKGAEGKKDGR